MSVYTKTGDRGKTGLFTGKRILKSDFRIQAIGTIDELNSFLGIIGGLQEIQGNLFTINTILAGGRPRFSESKIRKLENQIDKIEESLPIQKNFIYYGGTKKAVLLFYARALCRRAERRLVALSKLQATSYLLLAYMNRLSDYIYTLARYSNFKEGVKEKVWKA